jgi:hypothetical protein
MSYEVMTHVEPGELKPKIKYFLIVICFFLSKDLNCRDAETQKLFL